MLNRTRFNKKETRILRNAAADQYERLSGARKYRNLDFVLYLLTVITAALAIRAFLAEPVRVDGSSMVPTLLSNEHMFVEKVSCWFDEPDRGDIVICYYPGYRKSCVKRVIGLPGETVSVENGAVCINGERLDEAAYWSGTIDTDVDPVTVPDRSLFVMGDNRNFSKDSRNPFVGCIPYAKLVGRARAVVMPFSAFRGLKDVNG